MKLLNLWDDFEDIAGDSGRKYYRLATITWSRPKKWNPKDRAFNVPVDWSAFGGVYAFLRRHGNQKSQKIAYIGKADKFTARLTDTHNHFDIIERSGPTFVTCGRVAFDRIRSRKGYYLEIEDIIKFAVFENLENKQGFDSLPGFRVTSPKVMMPWVIKNTGYRFDGIMPKRIVYPAIGIE
jgi:hypothetical protein